MVDDKPAADDPARPQPSRRAKRQPPTIEGSAKDITKDITNETEAAAAAARAADEAATASRQADPAASAPEREPPTETPSSPFQSESARDFIARDAQQNDAQSSRDAMADPVARGRARTIWSETGSPSRSWKENGSIGQVFFVLHFTCNTGKRILVGGLLTANQQTSKLPE